MNDEQFFDLINPVRNSGVIMKHDLMTDSWTPVTQDEYNHLVEQCSKFGRLANQFVRDFKEICRDDRKIS